MIAPDDEIEITFTVTAKVKRSAMFLRNLQAEIEQGDYAGSTYCTNVGGGAPILSLRKGEERTESWLPIKPLLAAWIEALDPQP